MALDIEKEKASLRSAVMGVEVFAPAMAETYAMVRSLPEEHERGAMMEAFRGGCRDMVVALRKQADAIEALLAQIEP